MNSKQLVILGLVLAVLGGAALMLLKRDAATRQGSGRDSTAGILPDLPVGEELAEIHIQRGTNTLTLAKVDDLWSVGSRDNYPANYGEISRTVLQLRDLKAAQTEQVTESQRARLELLEPGAGEGTGTLIAFRDAGGATLGSLLLGKEQTTMQDAPASQFGPGGPREVPVGRWVMNPEDKTAVALVSDVLSNIQPTPGAWLNKDFFEVQKIKSIEVTYADAATNSFKVSRESESGSWTLEGLEAGMELDSTKTSGFNYALSSPSFDDVAVGLDPAELGLDQPTRITLETFDGFGYDITSGRTMEGKIPMRVAVRATYARERIADPDEDESVKAQKDSEFAETLKTRDEKFEQEQALQPWIFLVSSWTLDSVLKNRGDLVKEVAEEEPAGAPEADANPVEGLLELPEP
jgi:hypothetical protein